MIRSSRNYMC